MVYYRVATQIGEAYKFVSPTYDSYSEFMGLIQGARVRSGLAVAVGATTLEGLDVALERINAGRPSTSIPVYAITSMGVCFDPIVVTLVEDFINEMESGPTPEPPKPRRRRGKKVEEEEEEKPVEWKEEELNRLNYAKHLVKTGRISEE